MTHPDWLLTFCESQRLPATYADDAERWFLPLLSQLKIAQVNKAAGAGAHLPLYLGINGAQGSGKSTLAELLLVAARELLG